LRCGDGKAHCGFVVHSLVLLAILGAKLTQSKHEPSATSNRRGSGFARPLVVPPRRP
jgi:hypothetical protein